MDVSIVIPVYKVEPYLERCLRSVMAQTFGGSLECILVDDGSPDGSVALAEGLIAAYTGPVAFRIIRFPENRGLSIARNAGTDAATGEYLMYLDSDDALVPECVEKLMAPMRRDPTLEMVVGDFKIIPKDGYVPFEKNRFLREEDFDSRAQAVEFSHLECFQTCWNRLIRKDFLDRNGIRFKPGIIAEDNLWVFHIGQHLSHFHTIPDVTYLYCIRRHSMVTGTGTAEWARNRGIVFEEIARFLAEHGDPFGETWHYAKRLASRLISYPGLKEYDGATRLFRRGLRRRGQYLRAAYLGAIHLVTRTAFGGWVLRGSWALLGKNRSGKSQN